jgi:hypothetical protein
MLSTKCSVSVVSLPQYTATLLDPCVASRALAEEASTAVRSANIDVRNIFARNRKHKKQAVV